MKPSSFGNSFREIVSIYGKKVAISCFENDFTYEELNTLSNQIAHKIVSKSGGKPERINLLFDQSYEAIASMFGVLKAGCSFVHLDASNPPSKLKEICNSCTPTLLLTTTEKQESAVKILSNTNIEICCIDNLEEELPTSDLCKEISDDTLAYIFYTSGSTGNPKGVCQTQQNLLHFVRSYSETLKVSSSDRLSLLYSLGFSASNMDIFSALLTGATLHLYDIKKRGTAQLSEWINFQEISVLHMVPTVFRHLCVSINPNTKFKHVRAIDLGGEAVTPSDIKLFNRCFTSKCILINHLAATEASVIAQLRIDTQKPYELDILPVGKAANGIQIKIVNPSGEEVPKGEEGEILISSKYICSGYWNQPDLTAKTFTTDSNNPDLKIYHSGDLGYFGNNGHLYYLGRKDHRVKIRGYSVDTNEVESAIRKCLQTSIKNVAVVARQLQGESNLQLAAFLVQNNNEHSINLKNLRSDLSQQLATYMLPSEFIIIESLPENMSGKIDRKSLQLSKQREKRPAQKLDEQLEISPTTQQLIKLTEEVLKLKNVIITDDFFKLGGDSLSATVLHTAIESHFKIHIPLNILFIDPSILEMSSNIENHIGSDSSDKNPEKLSIIPLRSTGEKPPLFLAHGAKGQAFVSPHFMDILGSDQPVYALQASGLKEKDSGYLTIKEMSLQYVEAIKTIQPQGPYFIGSICAGCLLAIEISQFLTKSGESVAPLLMIDPPVNLPGEWPWYKKAILGSMEDLKNNFKQNKNRNSLRKEFIKRSKQKRINLDTADEPSMQKAIKIAQDFRLAIRSYQIEAYTGETLLLGSQARLSKSNSNVRRKLVGNVQIFNIAERHRDVHDVTNDKFAQELEKALKIAHLSLSKK